MYGLYQWKTWLFFFFANPVHLATGIIGGYYIQDSDKIVNNMITKLKKMS